MQFQRKNERTISRQTSFHGNRLCCFCPHRIKKQSVLISWQPLLKVFPALVLSAIYFRFVANSLKERKTKTFQDKRDILLNIKKVSNRLYAGRSKITGQQEKLANTLQTSFDISNSLEMFSGFEFTLS
jgi:hypothetical protein